MHRFVIAESMRQRTANGEYPDTRRGACDLCIGAPPPEPIQTCDHRCVCGRQLGCEHTDTPVTKEVWKGLALAAADGALWAIERGSEAEAADYARQCLTACRRFQLAGGQPWE